MPLPLFLLGLLAGSVALGGGAHLSAQEKNEKAQQLAKEAKRLYDSSKRSLNKAQKRTQKSLLTLGTTKKHVLNTSISQFMTAYNRIKNAELSDADNLNELKDFMIDKQGVLLLKEMSDLDEATLSDGVATFAATSALVALGTTPLAAIAAPVVLFSGIRADINADENIEKAKTMYAEAEAAVEKMKTSEKLCNSISKKADMFNGLLLDLDERFSYCTALLDEVTEKKIKIPNGKIDAKTLTVEEKALLATTRALAGAVKSVISTPILAKGGKSVSSKTHRIYRETADKLPAFTESINKIKKVNYI